MTIKSPEIGQPVTVQHPHSNVVVSGGEKPAEEKIFPPHWKFTREVEKAITKGARAKVTLRVVDSMGKTVPGARVKLNFTVFERKGNFETGLTDSQGFFTAEKDSMAECNWFIEKDGYYKTAGRHSFASNLTNDSVKDGRWMPWNQTLEVVLKEARKPSPMTIKGIDFKLPQGETLGFDSMKGDWVPPYGTGEVSDFSFMYQSDYGGAFGYMTNRLFVASAGCGGFVTCKGDNFSEMWSAYEAPETGYRTRITFAHARTPDRISKNETLLKDSYLIFRSRVNTDQSGKVLAAHYGKLYQFEYGEDYKKHGFGFVRFTYYFNPRPNDRNLEAEGRYP